MTHNRPPTQCFGTAYQLYWPILFSILSLFSPPPGTVSACKYLKYSSSRYRFVGQWSVSYLLESRQVGAHIHTSN